MLEDFKDGSAQTRGHYTGHYVGARVLLADNRFPVFPGLLCLWTNATKDEGMSCVICSKSISGLKINRPITLHVKSIGNSPVRALIEHDSESIQPMLPHRAS